MMKSIHVLTSREYDVLIGSGLLPDIGTHISKITGIAKVCVVSDSNVWPLYGKSVLKSLQDAGFQVNCYIFPAGEASKNSGTYLALLNHLAENGIGRTDLIIAFGGGVVGDLAGFAAATYLRGIPYIQVPTTLLATVDSSVGGKTAIDLPGGKNLVGAFYQPSLVLCDTDCLNTLPDAEFRNGCAEVIKYGILYDRELFSHLMDKGLDFDREWVISRCVELKRDVVSRDEFDTGSRMKLNLGHTIGHGVELLSNFAVTHGQAVAIGTAIVTRSGCHAGVCNEDTKEQILTLLRKFDLPVSTEFSARELARCAMSDKKCMSGALNLIIPEQVGFCRIQPTPFEDIQRFIEAGL